MPNTIRTIFTARTRFALLALGAISLSGLTLPAMAGDDAPDAGAKNPSTCRDLVNHKCLTKPRDDQSGRNQDSRNQDKAAQARAVDASFRRAEQGADIHSVAGIAHYDSNGRISRVDYPSLGYSERTTSEGILRAYPDGRRVLVYSSGVHNLGTEVRQSNTGGNGGAAGHTGARHTLPPNRDAQTAAPAPKAAVPKSTTIDKATNTMTRDYRAGATAAPGGPPPAAATGSSTKATAEQLAAQSGTRDHRRK